ncbi:MAG: SDR family oxidoreductase [Lachnospiraceae bacterium]|uniref:SDR family NAD(P)-dependent oxidoreductase n=1 Tax=Bariatricus sp. SGI.019 TaxID=3420548 RepID=UPI002A8D4707|nr:SDR family oxidoreductase [Lachnospiraceae bacterium]
MDYELNGKVAIVTGGGSGLGAATVELLLQEGANVAISYIVDEEKVLARVKELNEKYAGDVIAVYNDVSNQESDEELIAKVLDKFGKIDILINSAGIWPTAYVKEMKLEAFRKTLDINLLGPFILSKILINQWIDNGQRGKIINVVSQAAFHGSTSGHAHYASSKAGLVGFTVSLAREVAPYGINVDAVAPGIMRSPMNEEVLQDPKRVDAYLERIPLRRVAEPVDVARTILFLASSQADYITGATIDVTGGMLMR